MDAHHLHRRKYSKDEDENAVIMTRPMQFDEANDVQLMAAPPPRSRVQSTPPHAQHAHSHSFSSMGLGTSPPARGGLRNGLNFQRPPNGIAPHPSSPFRASFAAPSLAPQSSGGHSRTRSISAFSPSVRSPLVSSFPLSSSAPSLIPPPSLDGSHPLPQPIPSSRRHQRLHSRNISIFFPRPGSLPPKSISEDDQELGVPVDEEAPMPIPSAGSSISFPGSRNAEPPTPLGANFTFGSRPPSTGGPAPEAGQGRTPTISATRRGHHHKHSMSHNFFSFLEPGANLRPPTEADLHTQPTPVPVSPWTPISAFPRSAEQTKTSPDSVSNSSRDDHPPPERKDDLDDDQSPPGVVAAGFFQFLLGAWLWVSGQQTGSLSITGLGYWVVFDAFGVGLSGFLPQWLKLRPRKAETPKERQRRQIRRSYGNAPVETVLMFAQAVYLMFSSVYVCKETVEHLLLSAGGEEGHHHHHSDENEGLAGIDFPISLAFMTLISVMGTSLIYNNHSKLVNVTGNRISSLRNVIRSLYSSSRQPFHDPLPTSRLGIMLSNPFTSCPLFFCSAVLILALFVPPTQQRTCDLVLAGIIAVVTFKVAYRACVILGTVLLQTAPARGSPSGKMEAFLRAMREVERHPQVLHLPAPHIWQLTPSPSLYLPATSGKAYNGAAVESLVVTIELHVRQDLGDDDVLKLTRWAWEKCASALGGGKLRKEGGTETGGPEVTVGVVRG